MKKYLALGLLIFVFAGLYLFPYLGPFHFAEVSVPKAPSRDLLSGAVAAPSSPEDAALEYLNRWINPSDRPKREQLKVTVRLTSPQEAVVTIIDRHPEDDSLSATCDRLTMRVQDGVWFPVRHQAAWQGRGHFGWTTKPTT